jgi:hypothetical protein
LLPLFGSPFGESQHCFDPTFGSQLGLCAFGLHAADPIRLGHLVVKPVGGQGDQNHRYQDHDQGDATTSPTRPVPHGPPIALRPSSRVAAHFGLRGNDQQL